MRIRVAVIVALIGGSTVLPMVIGGLHSVGLNRAADGNESAGFARSYYDAIVPGFRSYASMRNQFAFFGHDPFGMRGPVGSHCQIRLEDEFYSDRIPEYSLAGTALKVQRSVVLEAMFDEPGVMAIDKLPEFVTGALKGCRYTLLASGCDRWGRSLIADANNERRADLATQRAEWLRTNEATSCAVADLVEAARR